MASPSHYDLVVIGGGAAGLSAAIAVQRFVLTVLVIDAGSPRNAPADHMHNYLGLEGSNPLRLVETGRKTFADYGGSLIQDTVTSVVSAPSGSTQRTYKTLFEVQTLSGATYLARKVVVASGIVDTLPNIDGLKALWGKRAFHCPFCHGYEVRDNVIAVIASSPFVYHSLTMWAALSPHNTRLFLHTQPEPSDEQAESLAARNIEVVRGVVTRVETDASNSVRVVLESGESVLVEAVAVLPVMEPKVAFLEALGLTPDPLPPVGPKIGSALVGDPNGRTKVPGLFVAGNVSDLMATVSISAAAGMKVSAAVVQEILEENSAATLQEYRLKRAGQK